ncbi:MAG: hypothetical protein ACR2IT_00485 [Pirellulales bacterium]
MPGFDGDIRLIAFITDRDAIQASAGQTAPDELPVIGIRSR